MNARGWVLLAALATAAFTMYLSAALLLDEDPFGFRFDRAHWAVLAVAAGLVAWLVMRWLVARGRLTSQTVAVAAVNLSLGFTLLIAVDLGFTLYLARETSNIDSQDAARSIDPHLLIAEYYPNLYYPTNKNFRLHKPDLTIIGTSFGNFYHPSMLQSSTLRDSVLEAHRTRIEINSLGFRERHRIEDARIFALGDSLTFGWQVNADESWVGQLETLIGEPIYNLGIHDASPRQELLLLEDLLQRHGEQTRIAHLLWLIYEGNDLEDSYATERPAMPGRSMLRALDDTILRPIAHIPHALKSQSFITRLRTGQASLRDQTQEAHDSIDGVPLAHPLYVSEALGPTLFYRPHIEQAGQPESYTRDHPNRPALEETFQEMAALSRKVGFAVTVILAPTATRMHGPYYDEFPRLSERPHFLDLVRELADEEGFQVVDLHALLAPFASKELFYFRDDDHWNPLGNQRAATLIAREAFGIEPPTRSRRPARHPGNGRMTAIEGLCNRYVPRQAAGALGEEHCRSRGALRLARQEVRGSIPLGSTNRLRAVDQPGHVACAGACAPGPICLGRAID